MNRPGHQRVVVPLLRAVRPAAVALCWLAFAGPLTSAPAAGTGSAGEEFFEKQIRPLLAERCYECHSQEKKIKGGLRLDHRDGWARGGDTGPALTPGDPERSLLIKAVRWSDPDLQMPPKNKLAPAEIDALEQWVKLGAPDPRVESRSSAASDPPPASRTNHWAYQPVQAAPPPTVRDTAWPRTDIDRFILARLEARGLRPAVDAEAAALCRRLCFDLTGLPPTPEEIDEFTRVAARDPQAAIEAQVDRLLASPRFGEHWARHWFDVARYAESVTLRGFIFKEAWRYRDYVIDAFNRDVPFDRFIVEQIAGDLLPGSGREESHRLMVAATYLALGNWNLEEQDKELLRMDIVDDQLDTLGKAFLGQTLGCARCHDHKFDPVPTRDYYAMAGLFRNVRTVTNANVSGWIELPLPVEPEVEAVLQKHEAALAALAAEIKSARDAARSAADKKGGPFKPSVIAENALPGLLVDSARARAVGEWKHSKFSKHYIGDGYLHDLDQGKGEKTLSFAPEITKPGRYEVRLAYQHGDSRATNVPVTIFHAGGETLVRVNQHELPAVEGRFAPLGQFHFEANGFGNVLVGTEDTKGFVTADAVQFLPVEMLEPIVAGPGKAGSAGGKAAQEIKALEDRLKDLRRTGPQRPMVMGVREEGPIEDCPVHIRGSVHNLGEKAPRGFLTVAMRGPPPSLPTNQSGRLEFARWIAGADNPLTARVFVNRVWGWMLGEGLVRSVDNFGTTGEAPTNPGLLDHLARRFVEEGWSVKRLAREIARSRVYQLQAATAAQDAVSNTSTLQHSNPPDPENRLLSRAHRRRLTAEQLRDAMLSVSGQLDLAPPVGPSFPSERAADFGFVYSEPHRSVYAPVFRNALPEIFEAFDFAPPSMVVGRRNTSTVATQALFLMNHPFVREQAAAAATRLLSESLADDDAVRLARAHRLALGRPPSASELQLALQHVRAAGGGEAARQAAWTELFHALFASVNFRYLE